MKYKVEYSKTNDTYRVMGGDKIVTDFATKERADAEAKRLNSLQSVKDVDKAQEKKSLKEKIQELSLDQKAKLYFMGLVKQGKIDTLPEDPKAAYVSMMMDKDDYGRSISGKDKRTFVDPKDLTPAARAKKMAQAAYDKAEMNGDIRGMELSLAAMDIDKPIPGLNKRLKEIATELGYLEEMKVTDKEGNDVTSDIIKKLEKSLEDSGYKITKGYSSDADIRPGYKTRPVKEGIDPNSEIADYVEAMFNDSVVEKEGFQSDIWTKEEYAATSRDEGSVFMDLANHLNSVGGKDVLEGNPDIHLELLSNGDIKWSADVTFD